MDMAKKRRLSLPRVGKVFFMNLLGHDKPKESA
jgi:hypothetical protein